MIPVVEPTVATFVFGLTVHVPPIEGVTVKVPVEPIHTEAGELTVGKGFIVKGPVVALHPVAVSVNSNVAGPVADVVVVITPPFVIETPVPETTAQVPPDVGVACAIWP
jgi:hypothetical protein